MAGLIVTKTASQLEQEQKQAQAQKDESLAQQNTPKVVDNLANHVKSCWSIAKHHRARGDDRFTKCLRLRKGEYSQTKLNDIKAQGGSDIYLNLVGTKCNAAKAWLSDLYAGSGDKPFEIEPTPIEELDPTIQKEMIATVLNVFAQVNVQASEEELQQMAEARLMEHEERIKDEVKQESESRMAKMSDHIEDILTEGNFRREFNSFIDDLVTFPVAIFKGPIYRRKKKIKWVQGQDGKFSPSITNSISRTFKRVSPFDFYPSPSMTNIGDSWHIEHVRFTPDDLSRMRGAQGYNTPNIVNVLKQYRDGGLKEWAFNTSERERLEGKETLNYGGYELIDGLEWTGTVQGQKLIDYGITQRIDDPVEEYSVTVVVIGDYTVKASINPDPTGKANYYKACFRDVPNSFNGEALPEMIEDIQDVANATARALVNNMAIGAQPQVGIDISMLPVGVSPTSIRPGKVWTYASKSGQTKPGVSFFSPEIKSQELLNVYERFERYADEKSGIPAYAYGSDSAAGAGKTASGLSMLMNAASKTIKQIVRAIDINVIEPLVSNLYQSAMLDPSIPDEAKGDAQVKARGSDALMHKEATAMRQLEFMNMTNNPVDMQLIGEEGRLGMLETAAQNAEFPEGRVVPTKEEYIQRMMNAQPDPNQAPVAGNQKPAPAQ